MARILIDHCFDVHIAVNGSIIPSDGTFTSKDISLTFGQAVDTIEQTLSNNGFMPVRSNQAGGKVRLSNIPACDPNAYWNVGMMTSVVAYL